MISLAHFVDMTTRIPESVSAWVADAGNMMPPRDPDDDDDDEDEDENSDAESEGDEPAVIREPDE
jgi:hypothetical protein